MNRLTRFLSALLLTLALGAPLLARPAAVQAQSADTLELFVRRNIGYSGRGEIQGSFRLEVTAPADVTSVTYYIDETVVGTAAATPFRVDFNTDDYALGPHTLRAEGTRADGTVLVSAEREFNFVTAGQGWQAGLDIMVPMFSVLLGVMVLVAGLAIFQAMYNKRNPTPLGARRTYGVFGGTICPKCHRPFSRHIWGLNAGLGKFDRCDHCGKWSLTRALPLDQLRAAEAAELKSARGGAGTVAELSPEERLRKQLDDSRYTDHSP